MKLCIQVKKVGLVSGHFTYLAVVALYPTDETREPSQIKLFVAVETLNKNILPPTPLSRFASILSLQTASSKLEFYST